MARGKEGIIDFIRGSELKVAKGKRGHLLVVSHQVRLMSCMQPAGKCVCEASVWVCVCVCVCVYTAAS